MDEAGHHRAETRKDMLLHSSFRIIIIIIIIIPCSYTDSLTVTVPARKLIAAQGYPVVLGCTFSPDLGSKPDLSGLVVTWQRHDNNRVVHSFYYEQDQLDKQDPAYENRTALFTKELSKGNASVKIANVEVQDAGRYRCTVSTSQGTDKADLLLEYGAFYTEPTLSISVHSSDIVVQYETKGFPAPDVMWKGEHGKNLSSQVQTSMQLNETMGLYYITSSYTAANTPLNFTFILENQLLQQYLQRPVRYAGGQKSCITEGITLGVISVLFFVAAAILFWIYYNKR